jgi:hypothetical protein
MRPPKVVIAKKIDGKNLVEGRLSEPWEIHKRQEIFPSADDHPESKPVDIDDFNQRSGCATAR